jgi:hypothetical protein
MAKYASIVAQNRSLAAQLKLGRASNHQSYSIEALTGTHIASQGTH